jgi:hypothetical protein
MARPIHRNLTFKEQLNYKKHKITKQCKEIKKIWMEDMKQNWESYLIIAAAPFLGLFILYCMVIL